MAEQPTTQEAPQTKEERWTQHRQWLEVTGKEAQQNRERLDKEPHDHGRVRQY